MQPSSTRRTWPRCSRDTSTTRPRRVPQADLLAALQSGHVAGAAVDVFESEPPAEHEWALIEHPKLVATPHLGASTLEAQGCEL